MNIAICDADASFIERLSSLIRSGAMKYGTYLRIHTYNNVRDLWDSIENGTRFLALFLEIHIEGDNGFDFGRKVKEYHKDIEIIFVSECLDYVLQGFTLPAFSYIQKTDMESRVHTCVANLLQKYYISRGILYPAAIGIHEEIQADSIEYVEGAKNGCIFRRYKRTGSDIISSQSLDALEELLEPYHFIRLQKACLVNPQHIAKLVNKRAIMRSGVAIPVNRTNYQAIRGMYDDYLKYA